MSKRSLNDAMAAEKPLQVVGAVNAFAALLAEQAGFRALYLSGAGVANASHGLPDLGITSLADVVEDARRITAATKLPLLVDVDTGFGSAFGIARTIGELERAGAAGCHIEDQVAAKRCGHRPGKQLVSIEEMCDRIKSAVDARQDQRFLLMARTDALANEPIESAVERASAYVAAGADALFVEAATELGQYQPFVDLGVPVLANITEFGKTPLWSLEELDGARIAMALYPLSAFRAMSKAAEQVYGALRRDGTQKDLLDAMQTRDELYQRLDYHRFEAKLDELFGD